MPPHLYTPCMFVCPLCIHMPPYVCTPPRGVHNPPGAPMLSVLLHGFGALHVVGGVFSALCVLGHTTPIWGCLPLNYPPTLHCWFSVHFLFSGISVLMWAFPFYGRFWGCSPFTGVVGGLISSSAVHMLIFFL